MIVLMGGLGKKVQAITTGWVQMQKTGQQPQRTQRRDVTEDGGTSESSLCVAPDECHFLCLREKKGIAQTPAMTEQSPGSSATWPRKKKNGKESRHHHRRKTCRKGLLTFANRCIQKGAFAHSLRGHFFRGWLTPTEKVLESCLTFPKQFARVALVSCSVSKKLS